MSSNTPPPTNVRWTAFKRTFFAILTVAFAAFVVLMDGRPTAVFFGALVLLLVAFGVELRTVELPPGLTITFGDDDRRTTSRRGDDVQERSERERRGEDGEQTGER